MKLSTQSRYGVRAVFDIAYYSQGLEAQVKDISRRQDISPRYLEQIFHKLKKAGLVGTRRGPRGGYFLNKKPQEITVGEIIRVTERGIAPVRCSDPEHRGRPCRRTEECVTRVIWNEAGNRLRQYFDSITVEELCRMAREMGLKKESDHRYMYFI